MKNILFLTSFLFLYSCIENSEVQPAFGNQEVKLPMPIKKLQFSNKSINTGDTRQVTYDRYAEDFACNFFSSPQTGVKWLNPKVLWLDRKGYIETGLDSLYVVPWYFSNATIWKYDAYTPWDGAGNTYTAKIKPGGHVSMLFEYVVSELAEINDIWIDFSSPYSAAYEPLAPNQKADLYIYYNGVWSYYKTMNASAPVPTYHYTSFPMPLHPGDRVALGVVAHNTNVNNIQIEWTMIR